jgi:uncharacterized protein YdiU (UPF0061 family)
MIDEKVAITTRVAPSFLRVGQLELFGRRARKNEHSKAMEELEQIVLYAIKREYSESISSDLPFEEKIILFATEFRDRLTSLVANWIRVGYCQGNFNSDNTAIGGFTLDYGPFGFIDMFDPRYQPWTGGGVHFSFFNQSEAARQNFNMFCAALEPLLQEYPETLETLHTIRDEFHIVMYKKLDTMWANKLGLEKFDKELFNTLIILMIDTGVDYTLFFRELSHLPKNIEPLIKSFYDVTVLDDVLLSRWEVWFKEWKTVLKIDSEEEKNKLSNQMKKINPKYTLREWFLVPAYKAATNGDYSLINELQEVMTNPYGEQSDEVEQKYYQQKPDDLFDIAGVSFVSCSS